MAKHYGAIFMPSARLGEFREPAGVRVQLLVGGYKVSRTAVPAGDNTECVSCALA